MTSAERRQEPFLDHLGDAEKRLGGKREPVFDALVIGGIAVLVAGGIALGIMRIRTPPSIDRAPAATSAPAPDPVTKPAVLQSK